MAEGNTNESFYEQIGGHDTFVQLVDAFYSGVKSDPVLKPMYPEEDMEGAVWRLRSFLEQYWGGPHTYMEQRGHPRLRMRHLPFVVGERERDHWLMHMATAVEAVCNGLDGGEDIAAELLQYFVPAAEHLRNDQPLGLRP